MPIFAGEDIPHPDPDSPLAETGTNVHLEQMKDMLLTYTEYNTDLGYVQGVSDLLTPSTQYCRTMRQPSGRLLASWSEWSGIS